MICRTSLVDLCVSSWVVIHISPMLHQQKQEQKDSHFWMDCLLLDFIQVHKIFFLNITKTDKQKEIQDMHLLIPISTYMFG